MTCHHMAPKVDTGRIIAVSRFPIFDDDSVESLLERTYQHQLALFLDVAALIVRRKELPVSEEHWTRPPFTRTQFNELFRITPEMDRVEIARRTRAVSFGEWQPYLHLHGYKFELRPDAVLETGHTSRQTVDGQV